MKKIILSIMALALLVACDPMQSEKDFDAPILTAEQLKQYCSVTVDQENGKNVNHAVVRCSAPVNVMWTNNVEVVKANDAQFTMLVTGNHTLTCKACNGDGSVVSVEFPITVNELSDRYPVLPQWGYLYGDGEKDWTWDTESFPGQWFAGAVWGNMGYLPGSGDSFVQGGNGVWWGAKPEELTGQLGHSNTGVATGEEDAGAYMTFTLTGTKIQKFAANGKAIGQEGLLSFDMTPTMNGNDVWAQGKLTVTNGTMLFPFKINGGGKVVNEFEIMQLDDKNMKLIFAEPGTGSWSEATWWAFKAK